MVSIIKGNFGMKNIGGKPEYMDDYDKFAYGSGDLLDTAGYQSAMGSSGKGKQQSFSFSCYKSHPPLPLPGGKVIYGGSCIAPVVTDADVYVGLDHSYYPTSKSWPWQRKVEEVYFKISDMSVPKSVADFKAMIFWLEDQIKAGKKVHVGCLGGHGRTGMVLAALYRIMSDDKDATQYVRTNYCKKVVETKEQVNWLATHFDINKVEGSKEYKTSSGSSKKASSGGSGKAALWGNDGKLKHAQADTGQRSFSPVANDICIWGKGAIRR